MKVNYYPDTDTLYVDLSKRPGADAVEVTADLVVDVEGLPGFASVTLQGRQQSKAG